MITDCLKFTNKIALYRFSSFHFYHWNQFKIIPVACTLRTRIQETSPHLLRRPMRIDNTEDNDDFIQSQAANHHKLLSHVTLGLVECRKQLVHR